MTSFILLLTIVIKTSFAFLVKKVLEKMWLITSYLLYKNLKQNLRELFKKRFQDIRGYGYFIRRIKIENAMFIWKN